LVRLVVVGIHTPEFPFEKSLGNLQAALKRHGIRYPVAQDNEYATWNTYRNQYWPAQCIVDQTGTTPARSSTGSACRSSAGERSQSTSDEGKAKRMCGGGLIEGQGAVQQKPARAVAPETRLGRLTERELHLAIDPQRLSPLHHRPLEHNLGSGSPNPR